MCLSKNAKRKSFQMVMNSDSQPQRVLLQNIAHRAMIEKGLLHDFTIEALALAVKDYSHSTAPNRRFADLITQRLLKAAMNGSSVPYSKGELELLAAHCSQQEDAANKVKRQVAKSAAALLLQSRIGEQFESIVTGASSKGTWVRLLDMPIEGKLIHGVEGLDVDDQIRVQLQATNVEQGFQQSS
jgi:ribonuclease R